jgi:DNA repair protein RecN (Recombination protein N)
MLSWQAEEIAAAALSRAEEEKIEQEVKILANTEKISTAVNNCYTILSQGQRGGKGVVDALAETRRGLEIASRYDERLSSYLTVVEECFYQLEEVSSELRSYGEDMEFNPERLASLEQRLDIIYKLKRKYGAEIEDILKYYDEISEELLKIENYDKHIEDLEKTSIVLEKKLGDIAEELDNARRLAAKELAREILVNLRDLALPKALFEIEVTQSEEFLASGRNEVMFLFSANPGENVKGLSKIASGCELSRVALALKAVSASREEPDVMIFDEIDAGIGGQTAQMVAEKIAALATDAAQIICITHLPQIACMADCHIYVSKHVQDGRTTTMAEVLEHEKRIEEVAKMLSGTATEQSRLNAMQMLDTAKIKKHI